ncbi:cytochrome c oxidase subunit 2 [Sphingomonas zeicaulis]|uniref:cytochrome c oxidase subunit II n=1 Tax=Sphingomonas zeicaulis TaxID=1632740 RepID=UPI003D1A31FD
MNRAAPAFLIVATGCRGAQTALDPAGAQSDVLLSLFGLMLLVCGIVLAIVLAFLGASLLRARSVVEREAPTLAPSDRSIGRGLTVWIGMVGSGLMILVAGSFLADWTLARAERQSALEVRITGHQWWWRIEYHDPATGGWIETANELHLPADRTTHVLLGSADVIHSFWVPNVAGKLDMIPGRINRLALTPRRVGWFRGQCGEFCGLQHTHMALDVKVEPPADFARWLAGQQAPATTVSDPARARGRGVVEAACGSCHRLRGTAAAGRAGPDLTHLASRRSLAAGMLPMSRGAIQGWILKPAALKPGTMMPAIALSADDTKAASLYLATLR